MSGAQMTAEEIAEVAPVLLESIGVIMNSAAEFDAAAEGADGFPTLQRCGDIRIITKDGAAADGTAGAVIAFNVLVDGKERRAQAAVPVRLLALALRVLQARYGDAGKAGH